MKMKKLTALALAGVLCLGMSVTAFASDSVTTKTALDASGNPVKDYQFYDADGNPVDQIQITEIETTINNLDMPEDQKAVVRYWNTDQGQEALKDAIAAQGGAVNANAPIAIAKTSDIKADVNWEYLQEDKEKGIIDSLQVRFDVTDLMINSRTELTDGDILNLMHWVSDPADKVNGGRWVCIPTTLAYGTEKGEKDTLYAIANFDPDDEMSPILFVVQAGGVNEPDVEPGEKPGENPGENPSENPSQPSNPNGSSVNNSGNGSAQDQFNNLMNNYLKTNNAKVIRVSAGVSPKTGE